MNEQGGFHSTAVELKPSETGLYNVDLANGRYWKGRVHQFKLRVLPDSESQGTVSFESVAINPLPQGPANIDVMFSGIEDAILRAGYDTELFLDLVNCGGEATPPMKLETTQLPRACR
jgi:hypothetical protein